MKNENEITFFSLFLLYKITFREQKIRNCPDIIRSDDIFLRAEINNWRSSIEARLDCFERLKFRLLFTVAARNGSRSGGGGGEGSRDIYRWRSRAEKNEERPQKICCLLSAPGLASPDEMFPSPSLFPIPCLRPTSPRFIIQPSPPTIDDHARRYGFSRLFLCTLRSYFARQPESIDKFRTRK